MPWGFNGGRDSVTKFIVRKHVHTTQTTIRLVEKIYYSFSGVQCICGHTVFKHIVETLCVSCGKADIGYFRCAKCGGVPVILNKIVKEIIKGHSDSLVWLGLKPNENLV